MARTPFAPAPFVAPVAGSLEQRLAQVATAINRKADATTVPNFNAIMLQAPDGSTWQVTVDATGALQTVAVP